MRRLAPLAFAFAAACSGSNSGGSTGPAAVATVTVAAPSATIVIGQQITLTFSAFSSTGGSIAGKTATWATTSPSIASVTTAGVVTGVAAGVATITATVDGKIGTTNITVQAANTTCNGVTPLSLSVGEVRIITGADRARLCFTASGSTPNEYMLLAFNNSLDTLGNNLSVTFQATGTSSAVGTPASANAFAPSTGSLGADRGASFAAQPRARAGTAFDIALRQRARAALGPMLRTGVSRRAMYNQMRANALRRPTVSAIKGTTGVPAIGTLFTLNTNSDTPCSQPQNHTGRVAAITTNSIIIADTGAPAGGFTDADYASFGASFDSVVFTLDTTAFGAPGDMDANGRIVIFFTQAVNQLTPPGSGSVIGGFFYERDLFPVAGNQALGLGPCATSNEGEMFYVPVVDPNSVFNTYYRNKASLTTEILGTLAHEFQHLINASRRIYFNDSDDFEVTWLNEGLSHIAEELLFYHAAGVQPRTNITLSQLQTAGPINTAVNAYQIENLLRLNSYLAAPETNSPYKGPDNDDLATRGATWQFLRFIVDHGTQAENIYWRALVNSKKDGMVNLSTVFGALFGGNITTAFRDWALAQYLDDTGLTSDVLLQNPSWNFRSVLTNTLGSVGFPLKPHQMTDGFAYGNSLPGGGSVYMRFRVSSSGSIVPATLPTAVELVLVRTQ